VSLYENGVLVRTEKDRNGDGKPDVIAYYRDGVIDRQEEDSDFDGRMDRKSVAGEKGTRVQEADSDGNGTTDLWITTDAAGVVLRRDEDRSGDGKPDLSVWYEAGKPVRLEQDTKGRAASTSSSGSGPTRRSAPSTATPTTTAGSTSGAISRTRRSCARVSIRRVRATRTCSTT